jgi:hypothetical protein
MLPESVDVKDVSTVLGSMSGSLATALVVGCIQGQVVLPWDGLNRSRILTASSVQTLPSYS